MSGTLNQSMTRNRSMKFHYPNVAPLIIHWELQAITIIFLYWEHEDRKMNA